MNGPEHYREAVRLLREADDTRADDFSEHSVYQAAVTLCLQEAQVHATLALAAVQDSRHILDRVTTPTDTEEPQS